MSYLYAKIFEKWDVVRTQHKRELSCRRNSRVLHVLYNPQNNVF